MTFNTEAKRSVSDPTTGTGIEAGRGNSYSACRLHKSDSDESWLPSDEEGFLASSTCWCTKQTSVRTNDPPVKPSSSTKEALAFRPCLYKVLPIDYKHKTA